MPPRRELPAKEAQLRRKFIGAKGLCVYCGDASTANDHFHSIIAKDGMPSGYCGDDWNIVPACTTCNSSKGNKHWLVFMFSTTKRSPAGRGISGLQKRILTLEQFQRAGAKYVQQWTPGKYKKQLKMLKTSLQKITASHAVKLAAIIKKTR